MFCDFCNSNKRVSIDFFYIEIGIVLLRNAVEVRYD